MSQRETWFRDLGAEALAGRLDPVVARDALLWRALRVLARRTKRNLLLVGRPGVGKTALAEGLARVLVLGKPPPSLCGAQVLSLDLGSLLSGTSYRGEFEGRVSQLLKRLRSSRHPIVLFVDEIHLLLRAGRSEGGLDAANLLKPALARGELVCIGATTEEEWRRVAAEDPALVRRFTVLEVPETDREQTLCILRALRPGLEKHHGVAISDEALRAVVDLPYSPSCATQFPDRAIDRLDEACAGLQLEGASLESESPAAPACRSSSAEAGEPRQRFSLRNRVREMGARSAGPGLAGAAACLSATSGAAAPRRQLDVAHLV